MDDTDEKSLESKEDETTYLLKSPKNAERWLNAIAQLEMGYSESHELIE
jgi:PHD/YefM family antitoxin component YafN of YafNO toxin-antitoxin module